VGGGRADIDARQRDGAINVRAVLADVDLSALSQDMAGKIDATLTASGRGGDLAGDLEAALQDARSRDGPRDAAIDGTFKAALRGNRLSIDAAAANDKGLKSTASFVLPVEASATPFRIAINRRQAMQGRFDIDGELQPIWDLFFGGDRTLGGRLVAQGTVTGSLGDPRLNGQASLSNGKFEDFATGLKLRNVSINAALNTDAVTVSQFTAQDSNGGSLKGDGRVSLERGGASNFSLTATNFLLIDNDMATARASGEVTVTRDAAGKALLAGRLTVDRADVVADPPTPSGVVPMEVVEVNVPAGREKLLAPATRRGPSVALDVTLTAPRRVFVRGRGLDVELSLRAHVGGTTSSPVLDGTARVVRGDFNFASKRFEFDESGVIYLATSAERIRLDLQATREDPSLTAVIKVEGTAAKPQITLTSTPVLPNDEVLSQVLFGRSASQLSPLEAAQLASALSSLATGGGFDVIGSLRSFAGLDRLAFGGGGDQGGFSVSGGKYITDDVYLELTGGGREGTSAQVEWRVRRNLSIISRLGGDGDTRLSVRWRKDSRRSSSGALVTPR
jgi:translocation and assembly module TamB